MMLLDRVSCDAVLDTDGDDHVFFNDLPAKWCAARGYSLVVSDDPAPWPLLSSSQPSQSVASQQQPSQQQPSQQASSQQQRASQQQRKRKRGKRARLDSDDGVAAVTDGSDDEDPDDDGSDLEGFLDDDVHEQEQEGTPVFPNPSSPAASDEEEDDELRPLEQWLVDERKSVLLIGGPGTGKTEMIVRVVEMLARRGLRNVLLTGSTGRAAVNLQSRLQSQRHLTPSWPELPQVYTAHSADAFQLADVVAASGDADALKAARLTSGKTMENVANADVIVVDEISMVSEADLTLFYARAVEAQGRKEPVFLLVGDFYQLQPVNGEPCFDSSTMCKLTGNWQRVHVLTKNRRFAEDEEFARRLEDVCMANFTPEVVEYLRSMSMSDPPEGAMCITPQNYMCDTLNDAATRRLEEAGKASRKFVLQNGQNLTGLVSRAAAGRQGLTKRPLPPKMMGRLYEPLSKSLAPHVVTLHIGDMAMVKANIDTKGGIANGVRGEVVDFATDKRVKNKPSDVVLLRRQDDNQVVRIPYVPQTRDGWSDDRTRWRAAIYYMPLVRAWSITVHNAQGATIRIPIAIYLVDENGKSLLFGDWCRLLYVALSRATCGKQVYLVGFDKVDVRQLAESCRESNRRLAAWMAKVRRVGELSQQSSGESSQQVVEEQQQPQGPVFRSRNVLFHMRAFYSRRPVAPV
jgi:ATP-dependent exoDNAse (exonuclease V) alpha subunit